MTSSRSVRYTITDKYYIPDHYSSFTRHVLTRTSRASSIHPPHIYPHLEGIDEHVVKLVELVDMDVVEAVAGADLGRVMPLNFETTSGKARGRRDGVRAVKAVMTLCPHTQAHFSENIAGGHRTGLRVDLNEEFFFSIFPKFRYFPKGKYGEIPKKKILKI